MTTFGVKALAELLTMSVPVPPDQNSAPAEVIAPDKVTLWPPLTKFVPWPEVPSKDRALANTGASARLKASVAALVKEMEPPPALPALELLPSCKVPARMSEPPL